MTIEKQYDHTLFGDWWNETRKVINFSGGRSSAYMTITNYEPGDLVIFCDTGREHSKTYKFINDFEAFENIPVIRLQYEGGWNNFLWKWNRNRSIPNMFMRQCTIQLKIRTARRYLRSLGITRYRNLIGFRYDEPKRVLGHKEKWQKVKTFFPLYVQKVTKETVNDYWNNKPYKLEIPPILGNCDLCFMKGKNAVIAILSHFPELADKWIEDENKASKWGHTYFKGVSMKELQDIAKKSVIKKYDLDKIDPSFDCACTS